MTEFADMTVDEALAHYGVKGMKWGVRKRISDFSNAPDASGVSRKDVRKASRDISRKANRKLEDIDALPGKQRDDTIRKARQDERKVERKYEDVKRETRERREEIGKNQARIILKKAGSELYVNRMTSQKDTQSEKAVKDIEDFINNVFGVPSTRR